MLVAIVAIVCGTVVSMYKIRQQANLKQMMLEAGMPPHEIERVINCGFDEKSCKEKSGKGAINKQGPGKPEHLYQ